MENLSNEIRSFFVPYYFPDWIRFNLPDLLWVFGFTSVMLIIWKDAASNIKCFYIVLPLIIGIGSEILQCLIPNFGTYDSIDILFYTIGSLASILILKTINQSNYEKQNTSSI